MAVVVGGGDEAFEEGVRFVGFALEFGVELAGDEEGVIFEFDDFDEFAVGRCATKNEAGLFEFGAIGVVEFVAVTMAFVDEKCAVEMRAQGVHGELAGLRTQAHGAAFFGDILLFVQQADDRMRGEGIELG